MIRVIARSGILLALVSFVFAGAPDEAAAQGGASTASVGGKVTDSTGAVMPGVTVIVTNLATNQNRVGVTNREGTYRFAGLPPGKYSLTAELEGFAKFIQSDVTLQVGAAVDLNIAMKLSSLSEAAAGSSWREIQLLEGAPA